MTAFAAFGGILFGYVLYSSVLDLSLFCALLRYDTGVIAGVKEMPDWLQTFGKQRANGTYGISTSTESLVVSILSAGTFFGALLAVSDNLKSD